MKNIPTSTDGSTTRSNLNVIDMVPAGCNSFVASTARWFKNLAVAGILILAVLFIARLIVGFFIGSQVSEVVEHGARVAGLDESVSHWLRTWASWAFGFSLVGLMFQMLLAQLLPFGSIRASWKPLVLLISLSGAGVMLPVAIKSVRQVDDDGEPVRMVEVDPATKDWFNKKNEPLLWFVREADGVFHFFNCHGHRPSDGAEVQPVSMSIRHEWEASLLHKKEQAAAGKYNADMQRQLQEQAALLQKKQIDHERALGHLQFDLQRSHGSQAQAEKDTAEQRRLAEAGKNLSMRESSSQNSPVAPSTPAPTVHAFDSSNQDSAPTQPSQVAPAAPATRPAQQIPLQRGMTRAINVHGDNVTVWSDGPVAVSADGRPFKNVLTPGDTTRFRDHFQTINIRPLSSNATTVFVQKIIE